MAPSRSHVTHYLVAVSRFKPEVKVLPVQSPGAFDTLTYVCRSVTEQGSPGLRGWNLKKGREA
jgi:hypothetical protein